MEHVSDARGLESENIYIHIYLSLGSCPNDGSLGVSNDDNSGYIDNHPLVRPPSPLARSPSTPDFAASPNETVFTPLESPPVANAANRFKVLQENIYVAATSRENADCALGMLKSAIGVYEQKLVDSYALLYGHQETHEPVVKAVRDARLKIDAAVLPDEDKKVLSDAFGKVETLFDDEMKSPASTLRAKHRFQKAIETALDQTVDLLQNQRKELGDIIADTPPRLRRDEGIKEGNAQMLDGEVPKPGEDSDYVLSGGENPSDSPPGGSSLSEDTPGIHIPTGGARMSPL
jgi:hypothetical protein